MSLYKNRDLNEILSQLKTGSLLIKRKANGEKYSRHFYLDKYETYVSYFQTEKCLSHPRRCKCFIYSIFDDFFINILFLI